MPSYARQKSFWRCCKYSDALMRGSVKTASAVLTESTYLYHFFLPEDYHAVDVKTGLQLNKYSDDKELSTHQDWYIM